MDFSSYRDCLKERRLALGPIGHKNDRALNKKIEEFSEIETEIPECISEENKKKIEEAISLGEKFAKSWRRRDFKLTRRKCFLNHVIFFLFAVVGIVSIFSKIKIFKINLIRIFGIVLIIIGLLLLLFTFICPFINRARMIRKLGKAIESFS